MENENEASSEADPSTKDMIVDEGKMTVKDAGLGVLEALQRGGHRIVSIIGRHKKVRDLEEEVEANKERVKESIQDLED